jgi:hypothetical protein
MRPFLLSFIYAHPQEEGQNAQSIALVYADSFEDACSRINEIRAENNLPPCFDFINATIFEREATLTEEEPTQEGEAEANEPTE